MKISISIYEFIDDSFITEDVNESFLQFINEAVSKRPPTTKKIIDAITNRNFVGMYYSEKDASTGIVKDGFRLIEPYVYGKNKKGDREYIRAYVIMDTTKDESAKSTFKTKRKSVSLTKRKPYWRLFRVDRIKDWQTFPWKFSGYRELYTGGTDKHIANIIASSSHNDFKKGEIKVVKK
jgi:hypothetical protein